MIQYADIALNLPFRSEETLTYEIPPTMKNLQVGCRVEVPLRKRKEEGVVLGMHYNMPNYDTKQILRQIDKFSILTEDQITLAYWMKDYYLSTLGECLYKMIPAGRRNQSTGLAPMGSPDLLVLNDEQKIVYESIRDSKENSIHLIYGITGSGKTEIYIHLLHDLLANTEKSAILLVPEISISVQILQRLEVIFENQLALLHSSLKTSERFKNYLSVLRGEKRIIVGTRSAIFAPVKDLGLIILDEEHDSSYKEHSNPRYHARQIAQQRIKAFHARLVLGSATPSIESFYFAKRDVIQLHRITRRAGNAILPEVTIVRKRENNEVVGQDLLFKIKQRLERKEQVVILLNRRGYSPLVYNKKTEKFLECPKCTSNLCYHTKGRVICHLCGYSESYQKLLKDNPESIELMGAGTQKLEEYLLEKFPGIRLERLDQDSTSKKEIFFEVINRLIHKELDILTGTQMIAKGLDAEGVTLVGVINASTGLGLPDFRANERVFALLTQVSGRAGRGEKRGEVIIETMNTDHRVFQLAKEQNYETFFSEEILVRKDLAYPPFSRLIRIVSRSKNEERSREFLAKVFTEISQFPSELGIRILGPVECPFYKIDQNFRNHILIKARQLEPIKEHLREKLKTLSYPSGVYLEIDIDPIDLV
ncbi:MAG: primosomal protein N' [Leptospiraceae bacterium]|nr:primosomal protein N' [Leptospiraceae bacterium]MCP5511783.1 primosomal protein N' [Leptospiraceae bacterium]